MFESCARDHEREKCPKLIFVKKDKHAISGKYSKEFHLFQRGHIGGPKTALPPDANMEFRFDLFKKHDYGWYFLFFKVNQYGVGIFTDVGEFFFYLYLGERRFFRWRSGRFQFFNLPKRKKREKKGMHFCPLCGQQLDEYIK